MQSVVEDWAQMMELINLYITSFRANSSLHSYTPLHPKLSLVILEGFPM